MMTEPDSIASAKYGPLRRSVGRPISSANSTAMTIDAGRLHQPLKPKVVFPPVAIAPL